MSPTAPSADPAAPARPLRLGPERMAAAEGWAPSLDGLRALSIGLVMVGHLISDRLAPAGFGVATFFVISGFLISRLLLAEAKRTGSVSLPRFYGRRLLRLYPALLGYVAIVTLTYAATGHRFSGQEICAVVFYYANYFYVWVSAHPAVTAIMPFGIFWSLAVEEHFYLVFPPLLLALRGRAGRLFWAMAAVCAAELAWRLFSVAHDPALAGPESPIYYRTDYRLDSLAFGVALTAACETARGRAAVLWLGRPLPVALATIALLASFGWRDPAFRETFRYSLQGAALAVLLGAVLFQRWLRPVQLGLNLPVLAWVGRLSYSLYIWHLATPEIARTLLPGAGEPVQVVARVALTFALAAASYYALERPVLRLRRRLGSRAGRARPPGAAMAPA